MPFKLPALDYSKKALAPYISEETLEFHHGKHHATYVKKLNELIAGSRFAELPLEEIVKTAGAGPIFNNAAQHWNHSFYWKCLAPQKEPGKPSGRLAKEIGQRFGDFAAFKKTFSEAAGSLFGSGWAWLIQNPDGSIAIEQTSDAGNPLTEGRKPLFTCDVWEHAYYIDYRNERPKYVAAFWKVVNWAFVESNLV